eukprot:Lankesteria_metandrocarpae@DN4641_c0_g1_i10.p1
MMGPLSRWIQGCCSVADITARAAYTANSHLEEAFRDVAPALLSLSPDTLSQIDGVGQHFAVHRLLVLAYQYSLVERQNSFSELFLPSDKTGIHSCFKSILENQDSTNNVHQPSAPGDAKLDADEMQRRIGRGEVIDRGEWIPGISEGKRKLTFSELKEFLEFSEELFTAGKEAWMKTDMETALTMYTQGVHLLEWVDGEGVESRLLRFLKNQSLVALKTERYHEAKIAATRACELDSHDLKARYRCAEALYHLGELDEAAKLYRALVENEEGDAKAAAVQALRRLQINESKSKSNFAFFFCDCNFQRYFF